MKLQIYKYFLNLFLSVCLLHTYDALSSRYNIPNVTSCKARRAFKTAAKNLTEVERNAVTRLLGHTPETAEKHYRMRTPADAFLAQSVVDQLAGKTRYIF